MTPSKPLSRRRRRLAEKQLLQSEEEVKHPVGTKAAGTTLASVCRVGTVSWPRLLTIKVLLRWLNHSLENSFSSFQCKLKKTTKKRQYGFDAFIV